MKKIIILVLFAVISTGIKSQTISGVVTYYFNDNYGNKPDVGSEIFIIDSANAPYINLATYDSIRKGLYNKSMYVTLQSLLASTNELLDFYKLRPKKYKGMVETFQRQKDSIIIESKKVEDSIKMYGLTTDNFTVTPIDERLQSMFFNIETSEATIKRVADGAGNYSILLDPGVYYALIRSSHRKSAGLSGATGTPYIKKVKLSKGSTKDVSYNFEVGY